MLERRRPSTDHPSDAVKDWPATTCRFFGWIVRYLAPDRLSIDRINYIFRHFIVQNRSNVDLEVGLWATGTFVDTLFHPDETATICHRVPESSQWTDWPAPDTPFPPLQVAPWKGQFLVLHGCAVVAAGGEAVAFIAPSLAGKTTLLTRLCYQGYKCLSDDLLFICRRSLQLIRYPKPVGIRDGMLSLFPEIERTGLLERAPLFQGPAGQRTWLVHLDDLIPSCYASDQWVPLKACVIISRSGPSALETVTPYDAAYSLLSQAVSSGCDCAEVAEAISRLLTVTDVYRLGTSVLERALWELEPLLGSQGVQS